MTNNWSDIGNATFLLVWGANPVENHPACAAHMNRARFPKDFFDAADPRYNKKEARLIVVDPRQTRTALQIDKTRGDRYVRIRPGTNIALANGLVRYILSVMETPGSTYSDGTVIPAATKTEFFKYLNQGGTDGAVQQFYTNDASTLGSASASTAGVKYGSKYTDARFLVKADGTDYDRENVGVTGDPLVGGETPNQIIYNLPKKASSVTANANTVYNRLKAHVAPYTTAVVANICGCTEADIKYIGDSMIQHGRCSDTATENPLAPGLDDPRSAGYRATSILYAMGITQHTCGAQNIKAFAILQTLLGNMGRSGGGINALRGIHNVQGSTDMGLLYGNIPAYSGNPTLQVDAIPSTNNAFGKYMDALWGNPLSGSGSRSAMDGTYADAYTVGAQALQQRGFYNMTAKFFGDATIQGDRTKTDACYSLWPKGNGNNHIQMFRDMASGTTKAAVIWGQNPAVTEPNQSKVREGLYNLDLLVVTDIFETETAGVSRKGTGVTYLLPACSHVEKAGSATNSGRVLQWRYQATMPKGGSRDDLELLLRLAKALDTAGAFSHIKSVWDTYSVTYNTDVYTQLYGAPYGFDGVGDYQAVSLTAEVATLRKLKSDAEAYTTQTVYGSEAVAEKVYREMTLATGSGGTIWIYTAAYNTTLTAGTNLNTAFGAWGVANRAKSRGLQDPFGNFLFSKWGFSWLVNRRVLYNNAEVAGDQTDYFMGPDSCSRLFVSTNSGVLNYSRWYRTIHRLSDKPDVILPATKNALSPHFVATDLSYAGRFPAYTEPYETPRDDLAIKWGQNTKGGAKGDLILAGTARGTKATYPFVLTTIRCVEHFQGGPITRNNWTNVALEPEPWIEINSIDAFNLGIREGDMIKVITARTDSLAGDKLEPYGSGFRARIGAGLSGQQRVAKGVVAIPWHWGDKGLSTGSRANDLTIDAMDANTTIPEYKACLCRLERIL